MADPNPSGVLFTVKFKSALPPEEVERHFMDRLPEFRKLPGLLQKYYVHDPLTDEWGGYYFWDSRNSLEAFLESDLRRSIPEVYEIVGQPRIETLTVVELLRPDRD